MCPTLRNKLCRHVNDFANICWWDLELRKRSQGLLELRRLPGGGGAAAAAGWLQPLLLLLLPVPGCVVTSLLYHTVPGCIVMSLFYHTIFDKVPDRPSRQLPLWLCCATPLPKRFICVFP